MVDAVANARAAVADLLVALDLLIAVLLPGTGKPYRPPSLTPEARAERDKQARHERLERIEIAPGETREPFDLTVADMLAEILTTADALADLVSDTAKVPRMPAAPSAFTDPEPYLIHVTDLLPACRNHPQVPVDVENRCDELVRRAHAILGLLGDGQVLDVVCPWCDGRTADKPLGGAKTMRVRAKLPPGSRTAASVDPTAVRWFVVCESGSCEPTDADCGERLRGRPAWPLRTEGEWLAQRIERVTAS